jgi:hypothetical protein
MLGLQREGLVLYYDYKLATKPGSFELAPSSIGAMLYLRARGVVSHVADELRRPGWVLQPFIPEPRA